MRNILIILGIALAGLVVLFSLIHIADPYILMMLAVSVLLIGIGVSSWTNP